MRTKDRPVLLRRALDSVIGQSFVDWQLILVNDGGDAAPVDAACDDFRERIGNRLTVLHHPTSKGMEAASNAGVRSSSGDLLVIHDDDDSWDPVFLEACVEWLDRPEHRLWAGVVTHSSLVQERIEEGRILWLSENSFNGWMTGVSLFRMAASNTFPPISFVFRRTVWDEVGPFREDLPVLGDWDFHLRVLLSHDIGLIAKPLARYHHRRGLMVSQYSNSVVGQSSTHHHYDTLLRNQWLRADLQQGRLGLGVLSQVARVLQDISGQIRDMPRPAETIFNYTKDKLHRWVTKVGLR